MKWLFDKYASVKMVKNRLKQSVLSFLLLYSLFLYIILSLKQFHQFYQIHSEFMRFIAT